MLSSIDSSRNPDQADILLRLISCFSQGNNDLIAYDKMLGILKDATGFTSCSIHLMDRNEMEMYLVASRDIPRSVPDSVIEATMRESMDASYMQPLLAKEPYLPTQFATASNDLESTETEGLIKGIMVKMPLIADEKLIGAMTIIKDDADEAWFDQQKGWLATIGNHLGLLISQRQDLLVRQNNTLLREREWTSKEIGERVLQYIGAMRLAAEHAAMKLDDEDPQGAKERLREVERLAASAYSDISEEIATLSFIDGQQNGVLACIREYLTRFQQQWNLPIVFTVVDPSGMLDNQKGALTQLFRVLQEALTNIRLHAKASQAEVSLETDGNLLRLLVIDDGCGFDPDRVGEEKLGIRIMQERAADAGGMLSIISSPDEGTVVRMEIGRGYSVKRNRSLYPAGAEASS